MSTSMEQWHSRFGGLRWRVIPTGVEIEGEGLQRTAGEPLSMRTYLRIWNDELREAVALSGVPIELLLMTIGTENGPAKVENDHLVYPATREEPGYRSEEETPDKVSFGPCHILLSTARLSTGDHTLTGAELRVPATNLYAAALYIAQQQAVHGYDPILVAACYNAGGLYEALPGVSRYGNRWHLRTYGNHLDRAARWYGDACAAVQESGVQPWKPHLSRTSTQEHLMKRSHPRQLPVAEQIALVGPANLVTIDSDEMARDLLHDLEKLYSRIGDIRHASLSDLWQIARDLVQAIEHWGAAWKGTTGQEKMNLALDVASLWVHDHGGTAALRELIARSLPLPRLTGWLSQYILTDKVLESIMRGVLEFAVREISPVAHAVAGGAS